MKKRKRLLIPLFLILIGIGAYLFFSNRDLNSNRLVISGNIEVTDSRLSFRVPGRLLERLVEEGETVKAGQVVARLDSRDQEIFLAQTEANLAYARAVLMELEAGSRVEDIHRARAQVDQTRSAMLELKRGNRIQEIADARAEVERAAAAAEGTRAQMELAGADHERYRNLYDDGVISLREYDVIRRKFETARSAHEETQARLVSAKERFSLRKEGPRKEQIAQARAALRQAEAAYALVQAGPRTETIEQARAKVRVAEEGLRQAQQQLAYTRLPAPFDGVVLSKAAEPGEFLNIGSTVITVAYLDTVWLRAYVGERDLGRVKLGQEVEVRTDTFPDRVYRGRVSFINSEAEFTPKAVQTTDERVKLVYRIKIDLSNPHQELKPGMPADAVIEAGQGRDGQ